MGVHLAAPRARDAKLAVLEWDAERGALRPSSLHYFEGDPGLRAQRTVFARPPVVRTDPQVFDGEMLTDHVICRSMPHQSPDGKRGWLRSTCHVIHSPWWHELNKLAAAQLRTNLSSSGTTARLQPGLRP